MSWYFSRYVRAHRVYWSDICRVWLLLLLSMFWERWSLTPTKPDDLLVDHIDWGLYYSRWYFLSSSGFQWSAAKNTRVGARTHWNQNKMAENLQTFSNHFQWRNCDYWKKLSSNALDNSVMIEPHVALYKRPPQNFYCTICMYTRMHHPMKLICVCR